MLKANLAVMNMLFWYAMVKLTKIPLRALDWLHQYTIGKAIIATTKAEAIE